MTLILPLLVTSVPDFTPLISTGPNGSPGAIQTPEGVIPIEFAAATLVPRVAFADVSISIIEYNVIVGTTVTWAPGSTFDWQDPPPYVTAGMSVNGSLISSTSLSMSTLGWATNYTMGGGGDGTVVTVWSGVDAVPLPISLSDTQAFTLEVTAGLSIPLNGSKTGTEAGVEAVMFSAANFYPGIAPPVFIRPPRVTTASVTLIGN